MILRWRDGLGRRQLQGVTLGEVAFMTFSADGRSLCTISRQTLGEPAQEVLWDIAAAGPLDISPGKQDLPMKIELSSVHEELTCSRSAAIRPRKSVKGFSGI